MASTSFNVSYNDKKTGMTALAGGATPSAAANTCVIGLNTVSTVATAGDSIILPADAPLGARVIVGNLAANKLDVFPNTGGAINAAAADANLGIAGLAVAEFIQIGSDGKTWLGINVTTAQS